MEIPVTQFDQQGLTWLSQLVESTQEEIFISLEGKLLAKLVPLENSHLSCLDLMRDGIGCIKDGPSDLSTNSGYMAKYGI